MILTINIDDMINVTKQFAIVSMINEYIEENEINLTYDVNGDAKNFIPFLSPLSCEYYFLLRRSNE